MKLKSGVSFICEATGEVVKPITIEGMMVVSHVYAMLDIEGPRAMITSICDGKHKAGSKHYEGLAFDVRTWADSAGNQMTNKEKQLIAEHCRSYLGDDWDVVVEPTHIHIEYDKR